MCPCNSSWQVVATEYNLAGAKRRLHWLIRTWFVCLFPPLQFASLHRVSAFLYMVATNQLQMEAVYVVVAWGPEEEILCLCQCSQTQKAPISLPGFQAQVLVWFIQFGVHRPSLIQSRATCHSELFPPRRDCSYV